METQHINKDWTVKGARTSDATHRYSYHALMIPQGYFFHPAIIEVDNFAMYAGTAGGQTSARIIYFHEKGFSGTEYEGGQVFFDFASIAEDLNKQSEKDYHHALSFK